MERCKEYVTYTVRVAGKAKTGYVCAQHLPRVRAVLEMLQENVYLVEKKYDGEPMYCQLPACAGGAGEKLEKPFSIFEPRPNLEGDL